MSELKIDYESVIAPYLRGTATTCSYCDCLEPLILVHGRGTYITLAIGQIVEGYLQVCAREHRTAATGLLDHEVPEFIAFKRHVRDAFQLVYGTPGIAFEHGMAGSCLWTDESRVTNMKELCYHTHIHMVPIDVDIRGEIEKLLPRGRVVRDISQLRELPEISVWGSPYLYFEDVTQTGYVYPVSNELIPRQFLRRCVASAIGLDARADWMRFPGTEHFGDAKRKLQPVLMRLVGAPASS